LFYRRVWQGIIARQRTTVMAGEGGVGRYSAERDIEEKEEGDR